MAKKMNLSTASGGGNKKLKNRQTYSDIIQEKIASLIADAKSLCDARDPERAVARLTRAISLKPDDPELFRLRAEAHVLASNYHDAIINFQKVLLLKDDLRVSMYKRLSITYYQYGVALAAKEKHKEAVEKFDNVAKYDPKNKEAVTKKMECLIAMQKYSDCMGVIEREVSEDQDNPDLYVIRAQLNVLFGQTTTGYYDVCKALELDENHLEAKEMKEDLEKRARECKNQAIQKSLVGKVKEALTKLNSAIDIDPEMAEYLILRGSLYRRLGDFNAAVDDFLLAMDKCQHRQDSPIYHNASKQLLLTYNDFAMECFKQRHFESAITLLNKAIKEEKREKGLYLNRGDCFYRISNLRFALSDYQQALELDPADWEVYCRVAVVCCEIGVELFAEEKYSKALNYFSAAIHHNPKVSWFYTCRARAKYELEDIAGSKEDIVCGLVLDPKSDACLSLIARLYSGKSKEELLASHEAIEAQLKLRAVLKYIGSKFRDHRQFASSPPAVGGEVKEDWSTGAAVYLQGIDLKVEERKKEEKPASGKERITSALAPKFGSPRKRRTSLSTKPESSQLETSRPSLLEENKGPGEDKGLLSPREWFVLSYPLPDISPDPQGILSTLKECWKEEHFHKYIYYSKKNCDAEIEQALGAAPEDYMRPPPPRIQNIRDLVIGGRSIVTTNSLIKSLKR